MKKITMLLLVEAISNLSKIYNDQKEKFLEKMNTFYAGQVRETKTTLDELERIYSSLRDGGEWLYDYILEDLEEKREEWRHYSSHANLTPHAKLNADSSLSGILQAIRMVKTIDRTQSDMESSLEEKAGPGSSMMLDANANR